MCVQYQPVKSIDALVAFTNAVVDQEIREITWPERVFPFTSAPVITKYDKVLSIRKMSYSLIPSWSKTAKPKFSTYNARLDRPSKDGKLELIYDSPTWPCHLSSKGA